MNRSLPVVVPAVSASCKVTQACPASQATRDCRAELTEQAPPPEVEVEDIYGTYGGLADLPTSISLESAYDIAQYVHEPIYNTAASVLA